MIEVGVVNKLSRLNYATVRFDRRAACENCNMCLKPRDQNYVELRVKNTLNAKVGDRVKIQMGKKAVLTASFIVYIIPLLFFAIALFTTYKFKLWITIMVSIISLIAGFIFVFVLDIVLRKKSSFTPEMVEVIKEID